MYQVGDVVCYENMGVCQITGISPQLMPGSSESQLYYTLNQLHQHCVIHTPVDNTKVFMRPAISKDEAERLIDLIPSIKAEPYHSKVPSELVGHYNATIKTYDCADLIELTMSIYAKKLEVEGKNRKFGTVDERFMHRAEELLYGELSVALGILKDEVPAYIASRVDALQSKPEEIPVE